MSFVSRPNLSALIISRNMLACYWSTPVHRLFAPIEKAAYIALRFSALDLFDYESKWLLLSYFYRDFNPIYIMAVRSSFSNWLNSSLPSICNYLFESALMLSSLVTGIFIGVCCYSSVKVSCAVLDAFLLLDLEYFGSYKNF